MTVIVMELMTGVVMMMTVRVMTMYLKRCNGDRDNDDDNDGGDAMLICFDKAIMKAV